MAHYILNTNTIQYHGHTLREYPLVHHQQLGLQTYGDDVFLLFQLRGML